MIVSKACTMNILLALTLALASVISYDHKFCFHLVLMLICFEKYYSVINLDLFWKQVFSYTCTVKIFWLL